jgi:glycosyltransferase involved in cell wall biosynthesis
MKTKFAKIGLLTPPIGKPGIVPLSNILEYLLNSVDELSVISGDEAIPLLENNRYIKHKIIKNYINKRKIGRIMNFILLQFEISYYVLKFRKNVSHWFLFLGAEIYLLPIILILFTRKPYSCVLTSSAEKIFKMDWFYFYFKKSAQIAQYFSNNIILVSPRLILEWQIEKHKKKIICAHHYKINFDKFTKKKSFSNRPHLLGFVGRLSEEKGIHNLIAAFPDILSNNKELHVLIGGEGPYKEMIMKYIELFDLCDRITITGWISHEKLPFFLNDIQLLIIPSNTEAGPIIMFEAMACGTPILATPVGMVPDYIKDGKTGFILENNSPECIAIGVRRALNYPDLEKISDNARVFVKEQLSFEKNLYNWREIIKKIESSN